MSRYHISTSVAVWVLSTLLMAGCSGSGSTNPASLTSPDPGGLNPATQSQVSSSDNYNLWGFWWIYVDMATNTWEITPDRGAMLHFNVRELLEDTPCHDCITILNISDNGDGTADISIRLRHPLPQESFTGFDVRAICMWKGSEVWPDSGLRTQDPDSQDGAILNPDGYTTLFNPTQFPPGSNIGLLTYSKGLFATPDFPDCTLNPYLEYMTDAIRHMYRAGQSVSRTWNVRYPSDGSFVMGYAVAASWQPPNPDPPEFVPDDFAIEANQPEPYKLEVVQPALLNPYAGSTAGIEVNVWDWQENSDSAWIECPELWTGRKYSTSQIDEDGYVRYLIPITNETGLPDGTYRALVAARDTTPPVYPYDYSLYKFFNVGVGVPPPNQAPTAAAEADKYVAYTGDTVNFHSLATDPEGPGDIVDWWWDLENDGTWDLQAMDVQWVYDNPGVYYVDHRVADQGGLSDDLEPSDLLMISILDPCCDNPPIAEIDGYVDHILTNEQITLTNESYDPDGATCNVTATWDLDNDGSFDDAFGNQVTLSWSQPGLYSVGLEATDSCGLTASTYTPDIQAHPGVTIAEDMGAKVSGTRYRYISADLTLAEVTGFVDVTDTDGPWNFTGLPLLNLGNHSAVLPPTQAECIPFAGDFTQPYDQFYKHSLTHIGLFDQIYIAENYVTGPDRLLWVGAHETQHLGSVNCYPSIEVPFPFWVFTDYDYNIGFPPIFGLDLTVDGYGEGMIITPYSGVNPVPCTVIKVKLSVESTIIDGQGLAYMFYLDNGYLVAMVGAYNSASHSGFDPATDALIGPASYNALFTAVPY